jgi:hypothetical protein
MNGTVSVHGLYIRNMIVGLDGDRSFPPHIVRNIRVQNNTGGLGKVYR